MKNIMLIFRYALYASMAVFLLAILTFLWVTRLSGDARRARANVENSGKVRVGMSVAQMKRIMGPPDSESPDIYGVQEPRKLVRQYYYYPPFAASDGIYFYADKDSIIGQIKPYEPT